MGGEVDKMRACAQARRKETAEDAEGAEGKRPAAGTPPLQERDRGTECRGYINWSIR